jgi:NADH-quinone oxidoreductase subunit M
MDWFDSWALTLAVFLPLVGTAAVLAIPKEREETIKLAALISSLLTLAVTVAILIDFDYGNSGVLQFDVNKQWIEVISSRYHLAVDGISLPLLAMTALIVVLCVIYSWDHFPHPHNPKAFLALMLVLQTGMMGTFVAQDLILFFIFFEVVLLPMYFMIGVWGGPNREYASIKFFLFTLFGSALMLLGFLALFFKSDTQTFDIVILSELAGEGISNGTQNWIFAGLFLGFAIKVPMFPFHTWLPDAHTEAPTVGSVILAAVLLKLGTYGFVRIALPILPEAAVDWAPWIGLLAVIGIIYGALACLAQKDMKRLIAFSSVAHMGFTMLGISTLTDYGINAAIFGMVAHGLITGMLFFLAGSVGERYGTREMSRLGGLLLSAPRMGWILGFCVMASLGLPGLAGFWGEFPAILSAYEPGGGLSEETFRTFMVVAAIGTVLAAGYLLFMLQKVAMGKVPDEWEHAHIHDVHTPEWLAWTPLLIGIVVLGLVPGLVFDVTDDAVQGVARVFSGS